jgi:hypothetical protein
MPESSGKPGQTADERAARLSEEEVLCLDDATLGQRLLDLFIADQAEKQGFKLDAIPRRFKQRVLSAIATQEAAKVENIPLEKALREAADGNFEKAGAIVRAFVFAKGRRLIDTQRAEKDRAREKAQREGGAKGAKRVVRIRKLPLTIASELEALAKQGKS